MSDDETQERENSNQSGNSPDGTSARAKVSGHDRVTRLCGSTIDRKDSEKLLAVGNGENGTMKEGLAKQRNNTAKVANVSKVMDNCPKGIGSPRPCSSGKIRRRTVNTGNSSQLSVEESDRPRAKSMTSLTDPISEEEEKFQPHVSQPTHEERRRLLKGIHRRDTPKAVTMETSKTQRGFTRQMRSNAICLEEEEDSDREPVSRTRSDGGRCVKPRGTQQRSASQKTESTRGDDEPCSPDGDTDSMMASEMGRVTFKPRALSNGSRKKLLRKNPPSVEPKVERLYATKYLPGDSTLCEDSYDEGQSPAISYD